METIICDTSAFLYWRTPPIARLLASAPEDDPLLCNLLSPRQAEELREALARESLLVGAAAGACLRRAHYGRAGEDLKGSALALSAGMGAPIDVMVGDPARRSASRLVRPRLWRERVATVSLTEGLGVVAPEVALQQIAARASLVRCVLLASEACGSFSAYRAPRPLRAVFQKLADEGRLPVYSGWSPVLDREGRLTNLWSRPPLATPERLAEAASCSGVARGKRKLLAASDLVVPGAASPFEVQMGILMGFSPERGGEGYGRFSHNHRVALSREARRLARRASCSCDLYWPAREGRRALDLECQSALCHLGEKSALSDADRATALQLMGVEVVSATYAQMASEPRFEALSGLVAQKLGCERHQKTGEERRRARRLRQEVLVDWDCLPMV